MNFTIGESFKYAWEKLKQNIGISLLATLLVLATSSLTNTFEFNKNDFIFLLALVVFVLIIRIGYNKIFLEMFDGNQIKFSDIFKQYPIFWKYVAVSIIFPILVLVGIVLLIIPGIFWAVRFSFSHIILVDTKMGPIESMKESYAITKGSFWKLLLFWLVVGMINLVGLIVFGLGLLFTIPFTTLATIYVYRNLTKTKAGISEKINPPLATT